MFSDLIIWKGECGVLQAPLVPLALWRMERNNSHLRKGRRHGIGRPQRALLSWSYVFIYLCMCVCLCVRAGEQDYGSQRRTLAVLPYYSPLRQSLSLNLELGWQPASFGDPPVSPTPTLHAGVTRILLCLTLFVSVGDPNSSSHNYTASVLTHWAVSQPCTRVHWTSGRDRTLCCFTSCA